MPSRSLSVEGRGPFFSDSFFSDTWGDFDAAMKDVLQRYHHREDTGLTRNSTNTPSNRNRSQSGNQDPAPSGEHQDMYREVRKNHIDTDVYGSQALQVSEKEGQFQAVMDVKDFNPRELQVRAVDDKIIVQGRYDKVIDDGKETTAKAFYRELNLPPNVDVDLVTTALSKDGVLTIKAPKKSDTPSSPPPPIRYLPNDRPMYRSPNDASQYMDTFHRDLKDRLVLSEGDSGRGSGSASPSPSATSSAPSSEAGSEASRVSTTMEFDIGQPKQVPSHQRSEVTFRVKAPHDANMQNLIHDSTHSALQQDNKEINRHCGKESMNVFSRHPSVPVGSGGTASVTVREEDGKRTLTSEKSSMFQERDGFMESKEVAAEVTGHDSQAARREASTKMQRQEEDPNGRFKKAEAADASDVSESCVQRMPDGSLMKVQKNSSSTNTVKHSLSSSFGDPLPGFDEGFGNIRSLMGRGHSLMSQMSSDSIASNASNFSDMSSFSRMSDKSGFSDRPRLSNMSDFSHRSLFSDKSSFTDKPEFSNRSSFNDRSLFSDKSLFDRPFPERSLFHDRPNFSDMSGFSDKSLFKDEPFFSDYNSHFSDSMRTFPKFSMGFPESSKAFPKSSECFEKSSFTQNVHSSHSDGVNPPKVSQSSYSSSTNSNTKSSMTPPHNN